MTGALIPVGDTLPAVHWPAQALGTVRFTDGLERLRAFACDVMLELGPHPTLIRLGRQACGDAGVEWLPSLRRGHDDWTIVLESLAALYTRGATIDWRGFDRAYARHGRPIPTYPFQRRRYWRTGTAPASAGTVALLARQRQVLTDIVTGQRALLITGKESHA
jgi:acyl transferase domain-containing protein